MDDFVAELVDGDTSDQPERERACGLSIDGSSNLQGNGDGVTLEGTKDILLEQSPRFNWKASNNEAGYEALLARMTLASNLGVANLKA